MEMKIKHQPCIPQTKNTLYRIGMFAAMNRVTVKTLRFYEEQNLLIPAYINFENGYRFYELSQMQVLHKITALKQAGFTLEEIQKLNNGCDENAILLKKKSELMSKIADLTKQLSIIEMYLTEKADTIASPVLIKKIPKVTVAAMKSKIESYDDLFEIMPKMGALMEKTGCECSLPEYCFTNYITTTGEIIIETCEAVVEAKSELENLYFKEFPEVQAACIFHKGSYNNLAQSYEQLLKYIEENGYKICGDFRESYIDGVWNKSDESGWLTEIQIPVN